NYDIGNNLNEGLLLSFETGFTPDWLGYSLDGQVNRTIFGNTTISFPYNKGLHTIQVFGNNSFGRIFQSELRYFTILYTPSPPGIPGFNIIIVLGIISIVSAILVKKKIK
ncbi:MAG: hypothetical protein ACFFDF_13280, partial [Candidatus Odinarchaeota archaeon]